jgi:hypothetical protein
MALDPISGLDPAIGLTGTELVPIVQGGVTKRTTTGAIGSSTFNLDLISSTPGAILYRGASAWSALGPGTLGQYLQQGASDTPQWVTDLAADISVGSTIITSGTNTRILYNNAGVLGEYTLTGTGTVVAMQTSPSLITPALGVATATSLAINGATIGANALAVTGSSLFGGVATITQGTITADAPQISGTVTWNSGGVAFTAWKLNVTDTASDAASLLADLQVGGVSQYYFSKSGGTGFTIKGGSTDGVRQFSSLSRLAIIKYDGSAQVYIDPAQTEISTSSGVLNLESAQTGSGMRLAITQRTITTDLNNINSTVTWNNGAVAFTGWKLTVTPTAADAASLFIDITGAANNYFRVRKDGQIQGDSGSGIASTISPGFGNWTFSAAIRASEVDLANGQVTWGAFFGAGDVVLARDAAGVLAQRNGTNAQTLRVYNTFTDASNYERAMMSWSGNRLFLGTQAAGTGTIRALDLLGSGISMKSNGGTTTWEFNPSGHLVTNGDNTFDIGASGATRPRNVYVGTSVTAGDTVSANNFFAGATGLIVFTGRSGLNSDADGNIRLRNNAGTDFGLLQFGGTTSSFPALKRSGAALQARLADDSANTGIEADYVFASDLRVAVNGQLSFSDGVDFNTFIKAGSGSPEGVVTASPGSLYLNLAGGTDTTLYTKNSGTGNTGWVAVDNV